MSEWTEDQDPYEILGLTQGHESTDTEVKKVRRLHTQLRPESAQKAFLTVPSASGRHTGC